MLQVGNEFADVVLNLAQRLLQTAQQFVFLDLHGHEIVVGQLRVLLLELAFQFVPLALERQFVDGCLQE